MRALPGGKFDEVDLDHEKVAEPDWIWLPNTLIDGAAGEAPPIQRLRQAQNPAALRLFVDLYHSHGLAEDGGIHWRKIRQTYERHSVGERGPFKIWGFQGGTQAAFGTPPFVAPHLTGKIEE